MVGCSVDKIPLYVYIKFNAKKGGNNFAYLPIWHIKQCGISDKFKPTPEVTYKVIELFFENCAG